MVLSCRSAQTPRAATSPTCSPPVPAEPARTQAVAAGDVECPAAPPSRPRSPQPPLPLSTCFLTSPCLEKSYTCASGPTGGSWRRGLLWNGRRILRRKPKSRSIHGDCVFIGDVSDMPQASVAISNCDGLVRNSLH